MISISIDPGLHGCVAVWNNLTVVDIQNIPYKNYKTIGSIPNFKQIKRWFDSIKPDLVVIEKIGASPSDGIASASRFTRDFGIIIGCCCDVTKVEFVSPAVWKAGTGLIRKPKKASIAKALELHPECEGFLNGYKNINDRADSVCIGHFWLTIKEKMR